MNEPSPSRELGTFVGPEPDRPIVVAMEGATVVVLGHPDADSVEVWHDDAVSQHPSSTPVIEVTDQRQWQFAVRRALLGLNHLRAQAVEDLTRAQAGHTARLNQIRAYAIDKHRAGVFDRSQLNEFLIHFEFKPYNPHIRLRFEINGSYEVASTDTLATRALAIDAIQLADLSGICGLDTSSVTYQTEIRDVTAMLPEVAEPRVRVDFVVTGGGSIAGDQLEHARIDARALLAADLSRVPALVAESVVQRRYVTVVMAD